MIPEPRVNCSICGAFTDTFAVTIFSTGKRGLGIRLNSPHVMRVFCYVCIHCLRWGADVVNAHLQHIMTTRRDRLHPLSEQRGTFALVSERELAEGLVAGFERKAAR